jgi:hypothetical protein
MAILRPISSGNLLAHPRFARLHPHSRKAPPRLAASGHYIRARLQARHASKCNNAKQAAMINMRFRLIVVRAPKRARMTAHQS